MPPFTCPSHLLSLNPLLNPFPRFLLLSPLPFPPFYLSVVTAFLPSSRRLAPVTYSLPYPTTFISCLPFPSGMFPSFLSMPCLFTYITHFLLFLFSPLNYKSLRYLNPVSLIHPAFPFPFIFLRSLHSMFSSYVFSKSSSFFSIHPFFHSTPLRL